MKSKKIYVFIIQSILFYALTPFVLHAQNKTDDPSLATFYLKAEAGYGFGINGQFLTRDLNGAVSSSVSKIGNGLFGMASGGYRYNDNLGAELGIGYGYGFKNNEFPPERGNYVALNGNMWQVIPSIVFSSKIGKFTSYIRTGLIIGSPEVFVDEISHYALNPNTDNVEDTKLKLYSGLATGIQTALGCSMPLKNRRWVVFAEASFNDIGFLPQKGILYSETIDGADQLSKLTVNEKEEVFKKSYSNNPFVNNPSQPEPSAETKLPFGSMALNVGIKMNIGNTQVPVVDDYVHQHYFLRADFGYGLSANGDVNYNASHGAYNAINVSYGNGINGGIGVAYMINETLGFDLGLNYVASTTIKPDGGGILTQSPYQTGNQTSEYGNMIQLNPSLVLATHIHKLEPFARLGILLGSGNIYYTFEDTHAFLNGGYFDRQTTLKYYGGTSVGYRAVLGTGVWLSYRYDLIAEACFNSIYEIPEKAQVIKDNYDGTSNLDHETTSDKDVVFKSSFTANSTQDPNSPSVSSIVKFSFNAVVFRIGIRRWF